MKSPSTSVDCLTLSVGEEETNLVRVRNHFTVKRDARRQATLVACSCEPSHKGYAQHSLLTRLC